MLCNIPKAITLSSSILIPYRCGDVCFSILSIVFIKLLVYVLTASVIFHEFQQVQQQLIYISFIPATPTTIGSNAMKFLMALNHCQGISWSIQTSVRSQRKYQEINLKKKILLIILYILNIFLISLMPSLSFLLGSQLLLSILRNNFFAVSFVRYFKRVGRDYLPYFLQGTF